MAASGMDRSSSNLPTYWETFTGVVEGAQENLRQWGNPPLQTWPAEFFRSLMKYGSVKTQDIVLFVALAVLWTLLRYVMTWAIFDPFARYVQMTKVNIVKFPESAWKVLFYSFTWGYSVYCLIYPGDFDYFRKPYNIWDDWKPGMEVPYLIYVMYLIQSSFYLHSVYGTFFMDQWRKDSLVMVFHHFLTLSLIGFSYVTRYHKVGTLVLFTHDITDICLEFTKCNVYMKDRGGKFYALNDHISTVGFICFTVTWAIFRLYWYPLKVLYTTGYASMLQSSNKGMPFFFFFNGLLWILLVLNLYWFTFILNFLYKVLTGQMKEVDDVREEDVVEKHSRPKEEENNVVSGDANGTRRRSKRNQARKD